MWEKITVTHKHKILKSSWLKIWHVMFILCCSPSLTHILRLTIIHKLTHSCTKAADNSVSPDSTSPTHWEKTLKVSWFFLIGIVTHCDEWDQGLFVCVPIRQKSCGSRVAFRIEVNFCLTGSHKQGKLTSSFGVILIPNGSIKEPHQDKPG